MIGQIAQFGGSLVAILALFAIARWLKLGAPEPIRSVDHAKSLAAETDLAFDAAEIAIDSGERAALLADKRGAIMLMMPHGNRYVGRVLLPGASASVSDGTITIHTGERTHRPTALELGPDQAHAWMQRINGLE